MIEERALRIIAATAAIVLGLGLVPQAAEAQGYGSRTDVDVTGSLSGRAPWNKPWEYDSGSDNDRRPELPYYQQGRGQQTGGPDRNLLPYDGLTLVPR
jgi:hypothetical protein